MSEAPAGYRIEITRRAEKDIASLSSKLKRKLKEILVNRIAVDPHRGKKLVGDLAGYWSVRLTLKDRIVYRVNEDRRVVYVVRARTHYDLSRG